MTSNYSVAIVSYMYMEDSLPSSTLKGLPDPSKAIKGGERGPGVFSHVIVNYAWAETDPKDG